MKCKICGGELLFQDGKWICQSCGAVSAPDSVYENVDVYICYEENDTSGRRTKDSIIAQEVYQKLEAAKIATFYERISADGIVGDELAAARSAAMENAKAVLVLAASVAHFNTISEKYEAQLAGKTVVPFCVDVDPGSIPKSLSKIQAVNYSTIGWDADLVKGFYNMLGREKEVDTVALYGRSKRKGIIIGAIAALLVIGLGVAAFVLFGPSRSKNGDPATTVPTTVAEPETTPAVTTTSPPTMQEIYDEAMALLEQGAQIEALKLFSQIPDHPDSANQIRLIYAKYEGYYQSGDIGLHLNIADNVRADVEVTIQSDSNLTKFSTGVTLTEETITGSYRDNRQQTGVFELKLVDTGLVFAYMADGSEAKTEATFLLAEKSDKPFIQLDAKTLIGWMEAKLTLPQVIEKGYELAEGQAMDRSGANMVYNITDADISLSMFSLLAVDDDEWDEMEEQILLGVQAPAKIIAPEHIGKECRPFFDGDLLYWPEGILTGEVYVSFDYRYEPPSNDTITEDMLVGVTSKKALPKEQWDYLMETFIINKVGRLSTERFDFTAEDWVSARIETQNDTHYLVSVHAERFREEQKCAWYKVRKKDQKASFIKEGFYPAGAYRINEDTWFVEYLDFAFEYPDTFAIKPGTDEWDGRIRWAMLQKALAQAEKKYSEEALDWDTYDVLTENKTHMLILIRPLSLAKVGKCAWYKGNKKDGSVTFVKEGPYAELHYAFREHLWLKQYPDFAKEFPDLYGDPDELSYPYLKPLPYTIAVGWNGVTVYSEPSYGSEAIEYLAEGEYTVTEEQFDQGYNLWGKLESGQGWICVSDIPA